MLGFVTPTQRRPRVPTDRRFFGRASHRLGLAVLLCAAPSLVQGSARADEPSGEDAHSRASWATLLVAYATLGALTTGGAYLWRDNFVGRGIAITAGGWGGLTLGAGAGYGLAQLRTCLTAECASEEALPTVLGGVLGAALGTLAATFLTSSRGRSRPEIAAAGVAPALIYVSLGTIFNW
jgi:hypothetical protein